IAKDADFPEAGVRALIILDIEGAQGILARERIVEVVLPVEVRGSRDVVEGSGCGGRGGGVLFLFFSPLPPPLPPPFLPLSPPLSSPFGSRFCSVSCVMAASCPPAIAAEVTCVAAGGVAAGSASGGFGSPARACPAESPRARLPANSQRIISLVSPCRLEPRL